jgi:hypothetical protein
VSAQLSASAPSTSAKVFPLRLTVAAALFSIMALIVAAPAEAQERLTGKYSCTKVEVEGQAAPCKSPALILNSDGSYEIWGERGTYEVVQEHWLVLSHSKRRGLGLVQRGQEIIFTYRVGKQDFRVTFRRIVVPPPGLSQS